MLLEFRVANFRSIRGEQVLSLVASKDSSLQATNVFLNTAKAVPPALCGAAIYGANASGKSNILKAMHFMSFVVQECMNIPADKSIPVTPFRLDRESLNAASMFEATFSLDGVRYQYGFRLDSRRVLEEWLLVYKSSKPQQWFTRAFNPKTGRDEYGFSSYLTGQRKVWQESTRSNALFLSTAVQLNSESLRPIFIWLTGHLVFFAPEMNPGPDFSISLLQQEHGRKRILDFLRGADLSIDHIDLVTRKGVTSHVDFELTTGRTTIRNHEGEFLVPLFGHVAEAGEAKFELPDESLGTQRLFALSGPILDILQSGKTLVVDELDASLHPLLVRKLVGLFQNPDINAKGAQLIFTTHDTTLMSQDLFRRDQIWFTEKDAGQATVLYPLLDFSPRRKEALEKGYLAGRYGAVPFFADHTDGE